MHPAVRTGCAIAIAVPLLSAYAAELQRTYVASDGSDANPCTLGSPCRSFAAAQATTVSGGEIVALDAAGYGAITIDRSIAILANPGYYAGISASSGSAIAIGAPGVNVRLSGLKINGIGAATSGIAMSNGASLTIEGCTISGFSANGVSVVSSAHVRILDTVISNNGQNGIYLRGGASADIVNVTALGNALTGILVEEVAGGTTTASVTATVSSQNGAGFAVRSLTASGGIAKLIVANSNADGNTGAGYSTNASGSTAATMLVSASKATRNGIGFLQSGAGTFKSSGGNVVSENAVAVSGAITPIPTI